MSINMAGRKGAIELSLGFIVTVVFAVVLLSLAIFWLRNFFVGLEPLTVDLTQQAQGEIAKTFQNTDKNFAIWPSRYTIQPGKKLIMAAGIRNNDKDGRVLYYVVNMKTTSTDSDTTDSDSWILVPGTATKIDPSSSATRDLTLNVPSNAKQGNYLFDIYACYGTSSSDAGIPDNCNIDVDSQHMWGSPQPVTISVEG